MQTPLILTFDVGTQTHAAYQQLYRGVYARLFARLEPLYRRMNPAKTTK